MRKLLAVMLIGVFALGLCEAKKSHTCSDVQEDVVCPMVGGYTKYRAVEDSEKELLKTALKDSKDYKGMKVIPLKVATQVVAGTNYSFICTAKKSRKSSVIEVVVYQDLQGNLSASAPVDVPQE